MSSRARRLTDPKVAEPYNWGAPTATQSASPSSAPPREEDRQAMVGAIERDAFAKGYSQGEKAGAEAAAKRGEAMLRRLKQTLEELTALRSEMIHRTERQMVQLALAIAKRIVHREISLDRGLLAGMARVALDRLGEHATATIRLHPDDHAGTVGQQSEADAHVRVVADPLVSRGGCLVQSDFGFMDVSPDAQFDELARTLLGESDAAGAPVTVGSPVAVTVSARTFDGVTSS